MTISISIALCTFNGEKFLATQLDSLINQIHPLVKIYIFDDCSTDSTTTILQEYALKHPNIILIRNTKQLGFVSNFEQALQYILNNTSDNYIAFCDQDDIWHENKLSDSLAALQDLEKQHPNTPALTHCDLQLIDEGNKQTYASFFKQKKLKFPQEKSARSLLGYNGVMGNTLLINRRLATLSLPFPKTLKYHDYWISVVNELLGVRTTLHQPLIDYRIHNNNTSNNKRKAKPHGKALLAKITDRNYPLPFFHDQREHAIQHLLSNYSSISIDDREFLKQYHQYLTAQMSRLEALGFLYNNKLLKSGWKQTLSASLRILLSSAYQR